jgi:carbon-monoxide dehydrogenase medium subunit
MKRLRAFDYHEPPTLAEAIDLLVAAPDDARVLAGGTDLIVDMKTGRMRPSTVVNLKRIPELSGIEEIVGGIRIGALTKVTDVEVSSLVQERCPGLAEAASVLGSPPVRALATIGGNIGRASPASDLGPALIVHQAVANIQGRDGVRAEPVEALYVGPGSTTLASSDIITSITLPDPPPGFGSSHVKLGKRGSGTDIALAGVSASVVLGHRGQIDDCRIALVSLGPIPFRAKASESLLKTQMPSETVLAAAAARAASEARPIDDMRASASYRRTLARVLTLRALRGAVESAGAEVAA